MVNFPFQSKRRRPTPSPFLHPTCTWSASARSWSGSRPPPSLNPFRLFMHCRLPLFEFKHKGACREIFLPVAEWSERLRTSVHKWFWFCVKCSSNQIFSLGLPHYPRASNKYTPKVFPALRFAMHAFCCLKARNTFFSSKRRWTLNCSVVVFLFICLFVLTKKISCFEQGKWSLYCSTH